MTILGVRGHYLKMQTYSLHGNYFCISCTPFLSLELETGRNYHFLPSKGTCARSAEVVTYRLDVVLGFELYSVFFIKTGNGVEIIILPSSGPSAERGDSHLPLRCCFWVPAHVTAPWFR
jgi:hypothetical protein